MLRENILKLNLLRIYRMTFVYYPFQPYMYELKKWFNWYDNDDEISHSQFLYDYFRHYELTTPLIKAGNMDAPIKPTVVVFV